MTETPSMDLLGYSFPGRPEDAGLERTAEAARVAASARPAELDAVAVAPAPTHGEGRHFLFVTAPFGPFSRHLAKALRQAGARCERVLLNGGDLIDWGPLHATTFRQDEAQWPAWIARHLAQGGVSDLITHGDSHPHGAAAIRAAKSLGINVHVFEEGYLRPHWITLERDGVNAHSSLPRTARDYQGVAIPATFRKPVAMDGAAPAAVFDISRYHFSAFLLETMYPHYRSPYAFSPPRQAFGHVGRYIAQGLSRTRRAAELAAIVDRPGPLFLALLQRPGDSQLVRHSKVGDCEAFISRIVDSFARHAPEEARLLIKAHPLDHGLEPHRRAVTAASAGAGAGARVHFIDDGDFPSLARRACGVLSVNSTGGLAAMELGRPALALGEAIYDMPGLTHRSGLDSFWRHPEGPDPALFEAFRAVLAARTQINGAFSTRRGMALAVPEAARRMLLTPAPEPQARRSGLEPCQFAADHGEM